MEAFHILSQKIFAFQHVTQKKFALPSNPVFFGLFINFMFLLHYWGGNHIPLLSEKEEEEEEEEEEESEIQNPAEDGKKIRFFSVS